MELHATVSREELEGSECIAESGDFALYSRGRDAYLLVQRHSGTPWSAISVSGDGVFRIGGLFSDAMRHLYRDIASTVNGKKGVPA